MATPSPITTSNSSGSLNNTAVPSNDSKAKDKQAKKLANFFKEKEKVSKRYKSILTFIETSEDEEEERKFFTENYEPAFNVVYERFLETEEGFKKGKGLKDLLTLIGVVKKMVIFLAPLIREKWQIAKIGLIIERCLLKGNHPSLRLAGFDMLLHFMESLQNSMEEHHLLLFASAINFSPFITGTNIVIKKQSLSGTSQLTNYEEVVNNNQTLDASSSTNSTNGSTICNAPPCLFPATDPPSKQDGADIFSMFLDFLSTRTSTFLFWFSFFKEKYMKTLYPKIFQELRLMDRNDETGFKDGCPAELQAVLIDKMSTWGEKAHIFSTVWDTVGNGQIMLEIHRQTCLLPLSYGNTIKKSLQLYRGWLMNFQKNKVFADQLQSYWQQFITNLSKIFFIDSSMEELDIHHSLCKEVLIVYTYFSVELAQKISKETWEKLQYTTLLTAFELINKAGEKPAPNPVTALLNCQSLNPLQKNGKNDTFGDHLFGALYFFWIRSGISNDDMWKDMSKNVAFCTDWKANLNQWKEKVLQLTYILRDLLYAGQSGGTQDPMEEFMTKINEGDLYINSNGKPRKQSISRAASSSSISTFIRDPRLSSMPWTKESIERVWYTMLNILGNPTKISEPNSYEVAMSCIYEVVVILIDAEEKQPLNVAPPIPIMKVFLPWLIEACTYDEHLIKGLLIAHRTVISIFCRRLQTDSPAELSHLLSHFYRIIQTGLNNTNPTIAWEILEYSTSIFCYDLPGVCVLIPDFLREVEILVGPLPVGHTPTASVKQNALIILNSLICYPNHFEGLEFPVAEVIKPYETYQKKPSLTAEEVKDKISKIIFLVLSSLHEEPNTYLIALCGSTVLLHEELLHSSPRMEIVFKFINVILEFCQHPEETVAITATECLTSLSSLFSNLFALDKNFVFTLTGNIADMISRLIRKGSIRENVVTALLYCLREWLLGAPSDLLSVKNDKGVLNKVFTAIELSLLGEMIDPKQQVAVSNNPGNRKTQTIVEPPDRKTLKKAKKVLSAEKLPGLMELFEKRFHNPTHESILVKETAESVLAQLLVHYNNFPSMHSTSNVPEEISQTTYFGYNDLFIFGITDLSPNIEATIEDKITRVTIRDSTGKYVWEANIVPEAAKNLPKPKEVILPLMNSPIRSETTPSPSTSPSERENREKWNYRPSGTISKHNVKMSSKHYSPEDKSSTSPTTITKEPELSSSPQGHEVVKSSNMPKYNDSQFQRVDMLNQLLSYLSNTLTASDSSSLIPFPDPKLIGTPDTVDPLYKDSHDNKLKQLEDQHEKEAATPVIERNALPGQPQSIVSINLFQGCRLLFSSLGLLSYKNIKKFHLLQDSQKLARAFKELDTINGKEVHKIGVLYVAPGQEEQNEILRNEVGSTLYTEFTKGIGWIVDLSTHDGFLGGLDRSLNFAPYFATPTQECIFHVVTMMPSSKTDERQLEKKMHVGNDYVHIVWSEHKRDYRPTTISSQFVDNHIVIYPLPNGLFRVQIFRKQKIPFFGPLLDGMVLDKKILCHLIRYTSINASAKARAFTVGYKKPYNARSIQLKDIIQRTKTDTTISGFYANLFSKNVPQTNQ